MSAPTDVLLDHEVDGIREYDNPMPAWWLGIFYASIAFTLLYVPWLYATSWNQVSRYDDEMAAAEAQWPSPAEGETAVSGAANLTGDAAAGATVFAERCFTCHGIDGKGGIGPDLTDAAWIHGGTEDAIRTTVSFGVLEKGMLAWEPLIGAQGVADVSAYVHALGGGE